MFYYYIQLSRLSIYNPNVRQSTLYSNYSLLECHCELTDNDIDDYKLIFIGKGFIKDKHIQNNINKIVERLK